MSSSGDVDFTPVTDMDPNVWYQLSEARVDDYEDDELTSDLQVTDSAAGELGLWGARGHYWQFQPVEDHEGRYSLRSSVTGIRQQLSVCWNPDEISDGQTQPCLADSHGGEEQQWDVADWGNTTSPSPYYRFINVANGTDYWLDCHRGNPLFMSNNIDTSVYQPAQRWLFMSISEINDGAFSTTFTNTPTSTLATSTTEPPTTDATTTTSNTSEPTGNQDQNNSGVNGDDSGSSGLSTGAAAGIGVGVGLGIILLALGVFAWWWRRHRRQRANLATPAELANSSAKADAAGLTAWQNPNQQDAYKYQDQQQFQQPQYYEMGREATPNELPGTGYNAHELESRGR